ncbi:unnamed protein product [Bursaphelenchus xylophilus]|uniref:(pine wood nematode) hypothetical protein n=1 Tax=Bursaphelenchus xylophilus TaxID=6326 RepID=A0A7I8X3V1_BURXY|nr:unnamed protein product [Bursaphelenchus xylophilus]CAG9128908.1 unnamed protein product [Bursaphelenchus xylophilus]
MGRCRSSYFGKFFRSFCYLKPKYLERRKKKPLVIPMDPLVFELFNRRRSPLQARFKASEFCNGVASCQSLVNSVFAFPGTAINWFRKLKFKKETEEEE